MKMKKIRIAAAALALALGVMSCPVALAATDTKTYQAVAYSQATAQPAGQKLTITGKPNYSAATTTAAGNLFGFDTADGVWYICIGKTTVAAFQAAAPAQQMTLYGTYAGTLENGMPILDIQAGAAQIGDKLNEAADLAAAGQKALNAAASSTTQKAQSTPAQQPAASTSQKTGTLVWIPTNGGTKYHRRSTCSNMIDPKQVDLADAEAQGYTACKRCY